MATEWRTAGSITLLQRDASAMIFDHCRDTIHKVSPRLAARFSLILLEPFARHSGIAVAVVLNSAQSRFAAFQMKLNGSPLSDKLAATLLVAQFNKNAGDDFLIISRFQCAASGYALK